MKWQDYAQRHHMNVPRLTKGVQEFWRNLDNQWGITTEITHTLHDTKFIYTTQHTGNTVQYAGNYHSVCWEYYNERTSWQTPTNLHKLQEWLTHFTVWVSVCMYVCMHSGFPAAIIIQQL